MLLELMMRTERSLTEDDQIELDTLQLIGKEKEAQDFKISYVPVTIDVRMACPYNFIDDIHTRIYLDNGFTFVAKINYDTFSSIRNHMLSQTVKTINDFQVTKTRK